VVGVAPEDDTLSEKLEAVIEPPENETPQS